MTEKKVQLKVVESIQDDVNKGIVRIDSAIMRQIDVTPGMFVTIEGSRTTVAIVDRALPGDIGLNIVRMDGLIRRNGRTAIGEQVFVKKATVTAAKSLTIAPAREGVDIKADQMFFKQGLLGRGMIKGDLVSLGGSNRRRATMVGSPLFGDEIFQRLQTGFSGFGLGDLKFIVTDASPKGTIVVTENTIVKYSSKVAEIKENDTSVPDISYEDIGGLEGELKKVREMIELPLKHPEIFEVLGIEPPKGVLLHGPPGTGKTLLAKAVAAESDSKFFVINGPEIMSKFYGESEQNLRKIFEQAEKEAPSIIFIDELDAIAPKREESKGEVERRVVAQLLTIMDGLKSRGRVVVMAATNIPNSLDPALRRPGRFDREIEIAAPSIEGRRNILKIHTRNMPMLPDYDINEAIAKLDNSIITIEEELSLIKKDIEIGKNPTDSLIVKNKTIEITELRTTLSKLQKVNFEDFKTIMSDPNQSILSNEMKDRMLTLLLENMITKISNITHGFVGADLASLAKESAMIVLRRVMQDLNLKEDEAIPKEQLEKIKIRPEDFMEALKSVRPSAMREVLIERPNVTYNNIGGLNDVKQELKEAVEWPLKHKSVFAKMGVRPPKGVLLYGPPGTGKTLLAKAIANETEANFIAVKGPELLSKWVNETPQRVKNIFTKARQVSPAIIFIDEIDAIAMNRSSDDNASARTGMNAVNQLLTEMDGMQELNDVIVIAATNRPDVLDTALLRPGRFDRIIMVGVPDEKARKKIFDVHLKGIPLSNDVDKNLLITQTEGYVGADIEAVCREAAMFQLRVDFKSNHVKMESFEKALKKVRPSANKEIQEAYAELQEKFSSAQGEKFKTERPSYYG